MPDAWPVTASSTSFSYNASFRFLNDNARVRHGIGPGIKSKKGKILMILVVGLARWVISARTYIFINACHVISINLCSHQGMSSVPSRVLSGNACQMPPLRWYSPPSLYYTQTTVFIRSCTQLTVLYGATSSCHHHQAGAEYSEMPRIPAAALSFRIARVT